jgi:hypothetical protein
MGQCQVENFQPKAQKSSFSLALTIYKVNSLHLIMFVFIFPEDEKIGKIQGGHEHRQKDQLKQMIQNHFYIRDQKKGEESGFGEFNQSLENLLRAENSK